MRPDPRIVTSSTSPEVSSSGSSSSFFGSNKQGGPCSNSLSHFQLRKLGREAFLDKRGSLRASQRFGSEGDLLGLSQTQENSSTITTSTPAAASGSLYSFFLILFYFLSSPTLSTLSLYDCDFIFGNNGNCIIDELSIDTSFFLSLLRYLLLVCVAF